MRRLLTSILSVCLAMNMMGLGVIAEDPITAEPEPVEELLVEEVPEEEAPVAREAEACEVLPEVEVSVSALSDGQTVLTATVATESEATFGWQCLAAADDTEDEAAREAAWGDYVQVDEEVAPADGTASATLTVAADGETLYRAIAFIGESVYVSNEVKPAASVAATEETAEAAPEQTEAEPMPDEAEAEEPTVLETEAEPIPVLSEAEPADATEAQEEISVAEEAQADDEESLVARSAELYITNGTEPVEEVYPIGRKVTLKAWMDPDMETAAAVTWTSSAPTVVRVATTGALTFLKASAEPVTITAKSKTDATVMGTVSLRVVAAPTKVVLSGAATTMGVGEEQKLEVSVLAGTASFELDPMLTYTSSNKAVATVNEDGRIEALKAGSATITVKTYNSRIASLRLTVKAAPTYLRLDREEITLPAGDTTKLTATFDGYSAVTYTVEPADVATVAPDGTVTALKTGEATITAKTYNAEENDNCKPTCTITVTKALAGLDIIGREDGRYAVGEKNVKLDMKTDPECEPTVTWSSSDVRVVKVAADGTLTLLKAGTATITATAYNGVKADYMVTVVAAPTKVTMTGRNIMGVGETQKLDVKLFSGTEEGIGDYTFTSSNEKIATVDAEGNVTAISTLNRASNTVRITAKSYNGRSAVLTITVKPAPTYLTLDREEITLPAGDTTKLKATFDGYSAVTYTVEPADVATVAADGTVKALKTGEATITAKTFNAEENPDCSDTCMITVTKELAGLDIIGREDGRYAVGEKNVKLDLNTDPECEPTVTWKSSNTAIVKVAADGTLTFVKAGKATITATAYNNVTASRDVEVITAPTKVTVTGPAKIALGDKLLLDVAVLCGTTPAPEECAWTVTSSKEALVVVKRVYDVNSRRYVVQAEAKSKGATAATSLATITVKTYNGRVATLKLTVMDPAASITLDKSDVSLPVGKTTTLVPTLLDANGKATVGSLNWVSSDKSVATVDSDGVITAVGEGTANITVAVLGTTGVTAICPVKVTGALRSLTVAYDTTTFTVGQKGVKLRLYASPEIDPEAVWHTDDATAVTVNESGEVTFLKKGRYKIWAEGYNGVKSDPFIVNVLGTVAKVTVNGATEMGAETDKRLDYTLKDADGDETIGDVTWTSSNKAVATVSETGVVTALKAGTVTITAKSENGKTGTLTITVKAAPTKVTISASEYTGVPVGDTRTLTASTDGHQARIEWTSSDEDVATVNSIGGVKATGVGTAVITATSYNGKTASCTVTTTGALTGIELTTERTTYAVGETGKTVSYTLTPDCNTEISIVSSNTNVLRVAEDGSLTFVAAGTATLTASAYNSVKGELEITVKGAPDRVVVTMPKLPVENEMYVGQTADLTVTLMSGTEPTVGDYTVTSGDATVLLVNEDNSVTALKKGTATITATIAGGKTGTLTLTVADAEVTEAKVDEDVVWAQGKVALSVTTNRYADHVQATLLSYTLDDTGVATNYNEISTDQLTSHDDNYVWTKEYTPSAAGLYELRVWAISEGATGTPKAEDATVVRFCAVPVDSANVQSATAKYTTVPKLGQNLITVVTDEFPEGVDTMWLYVGEGENLDAYQEYSSTEYWSMEDGEWTIPYTSKTTEGTVTVNIRCGYSGGMLGSTGGTASYAIGDGYTKGDFVYKCLDDGVSVAAYTGKATQVTVPEEIEGLGTVIEIGTEAFMNNTTIQSIDLPDTVQVIGARAFKGCTSLSEMN